MGTEIQHETTFTNGTTIDSYLATAYAEGFCEGEGADTTDVIKAWSYICGTKLYNSLQGFFGRTVETLIERGILNELGKVNWELINKELNDDELQ